VRASPAAQPLSIFLLGNPLCSVFLCARVCVLRRVLSSRPWRTPAPACLCSELLPSPPMASWPLLGLVKLACDSHDARYASWSPWRSPLRASSMVSLLSRGVLLAGAWTAPKLLHVALLSLSLSSLCTAPWRLRPTKLPAQAPSCSAPWRLLVPGCSSGRVLCFFFSQFSALAEQPPWPDLPAPRCSPQALSHGRRVPCSHGRSRFCLSRQPTLLLAPLRAVLLCSLSVRVLCSTSSHGARLLAVPWSQRARSCLSRSVWIQRSSCPIFCLPACSLGSLGLNSHRVVDLAKYRRSSSCCACNSPESMSPRPCCRHRSP
jgi:hypothetical protein